MSTMTCIGDPLHLEGNCLRFAIEGRGGLINFHLFMTTRLVMCAKVDYKKRKRRTDEGRKKNLKKKRIKNLGNHWITYLFSLCTEGTE